MELLNGNIRKVFFKYLFAAIGSSLVSTIYSLVDMIVVGQYEGSEGTAALSLVTPVWSIMFSFGLLFALGGSVLYANEKGKKEKESNPNEYFTLSLLFTLVSGALLTLVFSLWYKEIFTLFGGNKTLLPLAGRYVFYIKFIPILYMLSAFLPAFLRNDDDPVLATVAVITGGSLNVILDYLLTFTADLGIYGAGMATAIGILVQDLLMMIHFFKKKNTLKIVRITGFLKKTSLLFANGFSTFCTDLSIGIASMLFNREVSIYLGTDALAVYGVLSNLTTCVQSLSYGVGQAAQPILSTNQAAGNRGRIRTTIRYSLFTSLLIGSLFFLLAMLLPLPILRIFTKPNDAIREITPLFFRLYAGSFLLLPFNIYASYDLQALLHPGTSLLLSLVRGLALPILFIFLLPLIRPELIFLSLTGSEALTLFASAILLYKTAPKGKDIPVSRTC